MKRPLLFGLLLLSLSTLVFSQSGIAGKWTGNDKSGNTLTLDLKVSGNTFTGRFLQTEGKATGDYEITDGKINGNNITFNVQLVGPRGDNPITLPWAGKLNGGKLDLTPKYDGNSGPVTLARTK